MKRTAFLSALAAASLTPTFGYAAPPPHSRIELGDDVLVADAWHALRGRRIGIITNQSGVTSELISVVDAVHRKTSLHITALFAPEHGLRGGHLAEGPVLEPAYESFIGLYPIAMRHGMTIGELAQLYNEHFGVGCILHVVPMRGWRRTMLWNDTGLAWVATSPMIPTWETTLVYPGTGLIDNAGINNGVGTAKPFFYAGG